MNSKLGNLNFFVVPSSNVEAILSTPTLIIGIDCDHPAKIISSSKLGDKLKNRDDIIQHKKNLSDKKNNNSGNSGNSVNLTEKMEENNDEMTSPHSIGDNFPSHSCIVGSRDLYGTKWAGIIQQQAKGEELIPIEQYMHAMRRHIIMFKHSTGEIPRRIVIYRDGVGENEMGMVVQQEMIALLNVCKTIHPLYQPDIVCMLVVKRHEIRFFYPQEDIFRKGDLGGEGNKNCDKNEQNNQISSDNLSLHISNPPIGTFIDNSVTRCDLDEFYLVSHRTQQENGTIKNDDNIKKNNNFNQIDINGNTITQEETNSVSSTGTLRPILYQVLYNTTLLRSPGNDQKNDKNEKTKNTSTKELSILTTPDLGELTHYLCFQRQSTPQSSSIVIPVEHADKLCERARLWLPIYSPENMHFFAGFSESKPVKFFWDDILLWEEGLHPNLWEIPFWA
jgi:hypothetical protein